MNKTSLLEQFNAGLADLRELFHTNGRLDDSNSKLDEIAKLLCLELAACESGSGVDSLTVLLEKHAHSSKLLEELNAGLLKASALDVFRNSDGESLLGVNPRLNLSESEHKLVVRLATLIATTFEGYLRHPEGPKTFEVLNEAFGHFVRDNFRNNIEDAQYMTPPEAVTYMSELGLLEVLSIKTTGRVIMGDISCGVGSFLAQFYRCWLDSKLKGRPLLLVGQDKVDRMARLAKLNLLMFGAKEARVTRGNSLLPGSALDPYLGQMDLILTNPPFGARFRTTDLAFHSVKCFPCYHDFIQSTNGTIDSELLFVDRYIGMLKPGGAALVVVPDGVVSAKGLPELLRDYMAKHCSVVSITELPAVAFAQAGTRTKTCILHFRKALPAGKSQVFISIASSLGFEVASRKGVTYKRHEGTNELPQIVETYQSRPNVRETGEVTVHSLSPSCVSVRQGNLGEEGWTPSHHSARRYSTIADLGEVGSGLDLVLLRDIVELPNEHIRGSKLKPGTKCISVLHVGDFGSLNVREIMAYAPKYPGQLCSPGDVLFSKINPRIPRATVVPDLECPLSCSSEFEVMRPKQGYTAYEVMLLLLSSGAQAQVQSLTSGTSSSHNRIKTAQLMGILLPIPKRGKRRTEYLQMVEQFERAHRCLVDSCVTLNKCWTSVDALLTS